MEYAIRRRLHHAAYLLHDVNLSVTEVGSRGWLRGPVPFLEAFQEGARRGSARLSPEAHAPAEVARRMRPSFSFQCNPGREKSAQGSERARLSARVAAARRVRAPFVPSAYFLEERFGHVLSPPFVCGEICLSLLHRSCQRSLELRYLLTGIRYVITCKPVSESLPPSNGLLQLNRRGMQSHTRLPLPKSRNQASKIFVFLFMIETFRPHRRVFHIETFLPNCPTQ